MLYVYCVLRVHIRFGRKSIAHCSRQVSEPLLPAGACSCFTPTIDRTAHTATWNFFEMAGDEEGMRKGVNGTISGTCLGRSVRDFSHSLKFLIFIAVVAVVAMYLAYVSG